MQKTIRKESLHFPKNLKAVLFDYDGVLADTMEDNFIAWAYAFRQYDITIWREDYFLLEGMTPKAIAEQLGKRFGLVQVQYLSIPELKANYYREHNNFHLYEGVTDTLKALRARNIRLALVSGAAEDRIRQMTPADVLNFFTVILSADHVTQPKPHPEPYLKGLKLLGVARDEAIVVENAPLGVQSAKAAGIYCIALLTTLESGALKLADHACRDMYELREYFKKIKQ